MSTMTAQIIAGDTDPWHGGIRPLDLLWLSEGISISWVLGPPYSSVSIAWETAPGHIYDDGMLMLALHGVGDLALKAQVQEEEPVLMRDGIVRRDELTGRATRSLVSSALAVVSSSAKLIVTLFDGSFLEGERDRIEAHPGPMELCVSATARNLPAHPEADPR